MFIPISMSEEGKGMSYNDFVRLHEHHYTRVPDPESCMKSDYKELTGKDVIERKPKKSNKKTGQGGNISKGSDQESGSS